jgi:hypothetical protein
MKPCTKHWLQRQIDPEGHAKPQPPQFSASTRTSVHFSPHLSGSGLQSFVHLPREHQSLPGQAWSHDPQCDSLVMGSMQKLPQIMRPFSHGSAKSVDHGADPRSAAVEGTPPPQAASSIESTSALRAMAPHNKGRYQRRANRFTVRADFSRRPSNSEVQFRSAVAARGLSEHGDDLVPSQARFRRERCYGFRQASNQ